MRELIFQVHSSLHTLRVDVTPLKAEEWGVGTARSSGLGDSVRAGQAWDPGPFWKGLAGSQWLLVKG